MACSPVHTRQNICNARVNEWMSLLIEHILEIRVTLHKVNNDILRDYFLSSRG